MDILTLLLVVVVGAALAYFFPDTKKVAYFVMAVCAFLWLLTVLGVLPERVHIR